MKNNFAVSFLLVVGLWWLTPAAAQDWPRQINGADGSIISIYQPQTDSFFQNNLAFHAVFSFTEKGKTDPVFGSLRALAVMETDRDNRMITILSANVLSVGFPDGLAAGRSDEIKETLECGIPGAGIDIPLDDLLSDPDQLPDQYQLSNRLNNAAPRIFVAGKATVLVLIDGIPRFRRNREWGLNVIANCSHTIVESDDGWFYLYGGRHWYIAPMPIGPYNHTTYIAPDMIRVQQSIDLDNARTAEHSDTSKEAADRIEDILVSTTPAELIQTSGAPVFSPIPGTSLLYLSNSNNDIFLDSARRQYYVLLSGRWYQSDGLRTGAWKYVPSDSLPPDFSRIPEGSPKDNILACVAGTPAAHEAAVDACVPQTARIPRTTVNSQINYDGPPQFAAIRGTHLYYALNTNAIVLQQKNRFFCVDKGVWFDGPAATGPWTVAIQRPEEITLIPPDCPVYSCKYVFIYEVTPDYVISGYTAGYLNAFIEGSTVVYGTGYDYSSWMNNVYYPRPATWGFGIWYNPWFGWCLSYDVGLDWLNTGIAWGVGYWTGGWWGPAVYRPPYIWHHFSGHGTYERDIRLSENVSYNNNVYRQRADVALRPAPPNYFTDAAGRIYAKDGKGPWLHRQDGQWKQTDAGQDALPHLDRQEQARQRSRMRVQNFRQIIGGSERTSQNRRK